MKKHVSLLLVLVLMLCFTAASASADGTGSVRVTDASGKPGDQITVDFIFDSTPEPGVLAVQFDYDYDSNYLEFVSATTSAVDWDVSGETPLFLTSGMSNVVITKTSHMANLLKSLYNLRILKMSY